MRLPTAAWRVLQRTACFVALSSAFVHTATSAEPADEGVRVELSDTEPAAVVVSDFSREQLAALRRRADEKSLDAVFALFVGEQETPQRPAMLGDLSLEEIRLVFRPRFPLVPGLKYRAVFNAQGVAVNDIAPSPVTRIISIDKPASAPTEVTSVYPSGDLLPENQLKFYIHFSAAMSRGEAYRHVHLLEESTGEVDYPFLELGEELWDDGNRRFTLFIDPGRIKRGLKPREDVGPSLEAGKKYRLVIDRAWRDAAGNPLTDRFEKSFRVVAPDEKQPAPDRWKLTTPRAGTRDMLSVDFGESLDQAMLVRVLIVTDWHGTPLPGEVVVTRKETRWSFRPQVAWQAGFYELTVDTALEDLAGNSIARPFEVDVFRPIGRRVETETISLPFEIVAAARSHGE